MQAFDAERAQSMTNVISKINANGYDVKFFIQASDEAIRDRSKLGSSKKKHDYEMQAGCQGINQNIFIGPGRG